MFCGVWGAETMRMDRAHLFHTSNVSLLWYFTGKHPIYRWFSVFCKKRETWSQCRISLFNMTSFFFYPSHKSSLCQLCFYVADAYFNEKPRQSMQQPNKKQNDLTCVTHIIMIIRIKKRKSKVDVGDEYGNVESRIFDGRPHPPGTPPSVTFPTRY